MISTNTVAQANALAKALDDMGFEAKCVHPGLELTVRKRLEERSEKSNSMVLIITNDYDVSSDKDNVRSIIHFDIPRDVSEYESSLEVIRMNGAPADCFYLTSHADIASRERLARASVPSKESLEKLLLAIFNAKTAELTSIPMNEPGISGKFDISVS